MVDRFREAWSRLGAVIGRRRWNRDLDDELGAHLALAVDEGVARGLSPTEARRQALLAIGGLDQAREHQRLARGWPWLSSITRDLRDAGRLLRRNPAFTAVAVVSLALGIGANTAMFSIFNALVLRPLPVRDPGQLVQLMSAPDRSSWTYPLWEQIHARTGPFAGTAAWSATSLTPVHLVDGAALTPLAVSWASGGFFDLLGIQAQHGRLLNAADETQAAAGTIVGVVSDAFWRRRLGGSPEIVGSVIPTSRFPVTVIGVAPASFTGPEVGATFDIALPMTALPPMLLRQRTFWWLYAWARLAPGQTIDAAANAFRGLLPDFREATMPLDQRADIRDAYLVAPFALQSVRTGRSDLRGRYRDPVVFAMAGVGLLLLIGCANLTNLLLARGEARRHELSLRLALGASRGRLIRQLVIESLVIAGLGAAAGVAVAIYVSRIFVTGLGNVTLETPLDWRVLGFTAAVSMVTALIIGLLPAFRSTRAAIRPSLAERSRTVVGAKSPMAAGLVVLQIAVSIVLVTGALLLTRTFTSLARADLGFDPDPVVVLSMTLRPGAKWGDATDMRQILETVRAVPGVSAAAFSGTTTPMSGFQHDDVLENPPGLALSPAERDVYFHDAGIGWFDALGMHVVMGRAFSPTDRATPRAVAVVNETLARRFFPDQHPIGRTLRGLGSPTEPAVPMTIVGVVNDSIYNRVRDGVPPTLYRFADATSAILVRAANGDPASIQHSATEAVALARRNVFVSTKRLGDQAAATVTRERLVATVSAIFGALALALAGTGIYGVVAYGVSRRHTEIGVRRALGATSANLVRLVLGRNAVLVIAGTAAGLIISVWALGFLAPLLYQLDTSDPATLVLAAALLVIVALAASWMPMRRALRVDPATVLRDGSN